MSLLLLDRVALPLRVHITPLDFGNGGFRTTPTSSLLLRAQVFLTEEPWWGAKGVSSWILSPSSFKNTVCLSYISQSCAVVGSTPVCNLKKKIQDSFCLTFPSVASSELLLILLACCRSGSVSKALPHTQQTLLLFSTAAPTTGQKVELSGSGLCFLNVQKTENGGIVWIYGNHWQLKK